MDVNAFLNSCLPLLTGVNVLVAMVIVIVISMIIRWFLGMRMFMGIVTFLALIGTVLSLITAADLFLKVAVNSEAKESFGILKDDYWALFLGSACYAVLALYFMLGAMAQDITWGTQTSSDTQSSQSTTKTSRSSP
ncbi:MAG: hypothetical protein OIF57_05465 [Marinobacterium sp.]|nr:hypothetical protein [Marinobacterium sp.]